MKKSTFLLGIIIAISNFLIAQDTILYTEGFEDGSRPTNWVEEKVYLDEEWDYLTGGGDKQGGNPKPDTAAFGNYNAVFFVESDQGETTKLVTPSMDISGISKPELHFWHSQEAWPWGGFRFVDELRVYYKPDEDSSWILMKEYLDELTGWVERVIQIPDSAKTDDFYIAFEGTTNWGAGTCVDEVTVLETEIIPMQLKSISVQQASTNFVATGLRNNPILRIDLDVLGNTGTLPLQSLAITSNNTDDNDIDTGGVKIFYTTDPVFSTENQIGTNGSFESGVAAISDINYNLNFGENYVWVCYDINDSATENNVVDGYIDIEDIIIKDTAYMATVQHPAGTRLILNTIFYDDFEDGLQWQLSNEFEHNEALGNGGIVDLTGKTGGNPDPDYAFSGDSIIGVDLTGIGQFEGNYDVNFTSDSAEYSAISPPFNLKYYKNTGLSFQRWLNLYPYSRWATISISTDTAKSWTQIWLEAGNIIADSRWTLTQYDISSYADHEEHVMIKFGLGSYLGTEVSYSGWNIDDVLITGDLITDDVGITEWIYPKYGCGLDSVQPIVKVANYGSKSSPDKILVTISFDGITYYTDTLSGSIPKDEDTTFTFAKYAHVLDSAVYDSVYASTTLSTDEDLTNNELLGEFYDLPTYTPPFYRDFETGIQFWKGGGTQDLWKVDDAGSFIINDPTTQAWITGNEFTAYANNDSVFVESPCFNFGNLEKPVFEFKYWKALDTIDGGDGVALQYSIDDGSNWNHVPSHVYSWDWNWYNNPMVEALGTAGWDSISQGWLTGKQFLPDPVAGQSSVKFRVLLMSDTGKVSDGFAFDEVKIYEAPPDVGVIGVDSMESNKCQFAYDPYVRVKVKNYGLISLYAGDEIIVGLDVNQHPSVIDTFTLASELQVDDSIQLQFTKSINLTDTGDYTIVAYTLSERDPFFYSDISNDTTIHTFSVNAAPVPGLRHFIYSGEPDTIVLIPNYDPDYVYFWHYDGSSDSIFNVPGPGVFYYTFENGVNGCPITDSVNVIKLIPDLTPDSILSPVSDCKLTSSEQIIAQFLNAGTDTFFIGRQIILSYKLNSQPFESDTISLSQKIAPGETFTHAFNDLVDLSTLDMTYNVTLVARYDYDSVYTNDTLKNQYIVSYGYPDPGLVDYLVVEDYQHTFEVDSTYTYIRWNDNPDDSTYSYTTSASGTYWVEVTDTNGCDNSDTTYLYLKIHDIEFVEVENPVDQCFNAAGENLAFYLKNAGTDTLKTGDPIMASYSINGGPYHTDTLTVDRFYPPNDSGIFAFDTLEQLTVGTHTLHAYISPAGDMKSSNDTLDHSFEIYANPVVDLGDDQSNLVAYSYTLDAGAGTGYAYDWQDDATSRYFIVNASTTGVGNYYWVTVTDTNQCMGRDTVLVDLIVYDVGISQIYITDSLCEYDFDEVSVEFTNYGNQYIESFEVINIGYSLNDTIISESVDRTTFIAPNGQLAHVLRNITNTEEGDNTMRFFVDYESDLYDDNDTSSRIVYIYETPYADFGQVNDTLDATLPYTLDAGAGYVSYLWQDMSTGQTFEVTQPGWYSVTLTNDDCQGTTQLYVDLMNTIVSSFSDYQMKVYPNPTNDYINIEIMSNDNKSEDMYLELVNIQGQKVWIGKHEYGIATSRIDIRPYPAGLYYLRIYNKNSIHVERIIIE